VQVLQQDVSSAINVGSVDIFCIICPREFAVIGHLLFFSLRMKHFVLHVDVAMVCGFEISSPQKGESSWHV